MGACQPEAASFAGEGAAVRKKARKKAAVEPHTLHAFSEVAQTLLSVSAQTGRALSPTGHYPQNRTQKDASPTTGPTGLKADVTSPRPSSRHSSYRNSQSYSAPANTSRASRLDK